MSFVNKIVLITGAGSGIGAAIALHFAKAGAKLCLVDINGPNLAKVCEQSEQLSQNKILQITADLCNDQDVKNIIQTALNKYNKIDVVINSAGVHGPGCIRDADIVEQYDKVMAINLRSVIVLTNLAIPTLIESKGCVINIASICANTTWPAVLPYALSKVGIVRFTKSVALELAKDGIRVNCISPGPVKTDILLNYGISESEQQKCFARLKEMLPLKKIAAPEDIAEMAAFLASDKASCITGSEFVIDCGYLTGEIGGSSNIPRE